LESARFHTRDGACASRDKPRARHSEDFGKTSVVLQVILQKTLPLSRCGSEARVSRIGSTH
jgi:hypothetical protein